MERPAVSLIICTRNRAEQLKVCLEYVARLQPCCSWELIVVNNGSSDGTDAVLADYTAKVAFPVTAVFESTPGLSRARNTGCAIARGEIIAFTDDDCYVAGDFIDRTRNTFEDDKIGFGGGRVLLFDPADYPITIMTSVERELFPPNSYIFPGRMHGANMAFRRQVLDEIGGFDPYFRRCGDDVDVQIRASCAGWYALYNPDVVVSHHHRRKAQDMPALWRSYGLGVGALLAKLAFLPETRAVVLPILLRNWYWWARRIRQRMPGAARMFMWEIAGIAAYFAHRFRNQRTRKYSSR